MGEPTNPYGTVHIVGTLTLDGKPIEGASVILHPRDRDAGRIAGGITDRNGMFTVTTGTAQMVNGAIPGEYDVSFSKMEIENSPVELGHTSEHQQPSNVHVIPQKYGNPRTSGLTPITVEAKGTNSFSFELTTAIPSP